MKVGILGAGQLARMLALAGIPRGIKFVFYDPNPESCAAQLGVFICAEYDDYKKLDYFVSQVDVVSIESENIPVETLKYLQEHVDVHPGPDAVLTSQDRLLEKTFFKRLKIPTPEYYAIDSADQLEEVAHQHDGKLIVKTRRFGYDGKGQAILTKPGQANEIWHDLGAQSLIAEQCMDFTREASLISVRSQQGNVQYYPLTQNLHRNGILIKSHSILDDSLQSVAEDYAERVLSELNYVGVLGFEFFVCNETLVANEIAPRVHNSGHWTIEGAATSQFENHLRAILDLPLGSTNALSECTMYNLIGTMPDSRIIMNLKNARLHDYGKSPRANRKLGHITLCDPSPEDLSTVESIIRQIDTTREI